MEAFLMSEPMISEVINVRSGFTEYVDLRTELYDVYKNQARLSSYRPIKAHREVFQKVFKQHTMKDKHCYLIQSVYGTGKSHLCLILANYLQLPADDPSLQEFYTQYRSADAEEAEKLRAGRASGRYLVALCNWGFHAEFDDIVLQAVDTALTREGFAEELQTPYLQAHKKLQEWQNLKGQGGSASHFARTFEQRLALISPDQTLDAFKKQLLSFERPALETFRRIHKEITTVPFASSAGDLVDILKATLSSPAFKERFLGLVVLFDEFGDKMAQGEMNPKAFQQFAQVCANPPSNCAQLLFIGTSHKDLKYYAKSYNATEFRLASDRIETISLEQTGTEDIVLSIIQPNKTSPLWKEQVAPHSQIWDKLLDDCLRLKLFPELPRAKLRETIIEDFYPMHPLASYVLFHLVKDVASNTRSVFTFFSEEKTPEAPAGSFGHYIATTSISSGTKLNLYPADLLFEYFAAHLQSDNNELRLPIRAHLKDYERANRSLQAMPDQEFQRDPLVTRILRLIVIYNIIEFPCTLDTLQLGLDVTEPAERSALDNRLRQLISKRIIYHSRETDIYEFKQSSSADLELLLDDYQRDPTAPVLNSALQLSQHVPFDKRDTYLDAKDYNALHLEDKRLERRIVRAIDLGEEEMLPDGTRSLFAKLDEEVDRGIEHRGDFEGIALYVLCETAEDIQRAKDLCVRNTSERIVVGVPKQPVDIRELLREIEALRFYQSRSDSESLNAQERATLDERLNGSEGGPLGALARLRAKRDKLLSGKDMVWYGEAGRVLILQESNPHDVANVVMERLYAGSQGKHNTFRHDDFNKVHTKGDRTRTTALRDAVRKLLDPFTALSIDPTLPKSYGETRYLYDCLLQNGALIPLKTEGKRCSCELETEVSKYAGKWPALAAMVTQISALRPGEKLRIVDWLNTYRKPPYGQGTPALVLAFAYICRLFGESISVKQDESAIGNIPLQNEEAIMRLVDGNTPRAILGYRPLKPEECSWFNAIVRLFGPVSPATKQDATALKAYTLIKAWWDALPPLARVEGIYPTAEYPITEGFIEVMEKSGMRDARTFILEELPHALDPGDKISAQTLEAFIARLAQEKQTLESALTLMTGCIEDTLCTLFGLPPKSPTSELIATVVTWYKALEPYQKDSYSPSHTKESRVLLLASRSIDSIEETFLTRLPSDYGFKPVAQWRVNHLAEYMGRIRAAKEHIDAQKSSVEMPEVMYHGDYETEGDGDISFSKALSLTFQHPKPSTKIWVSEGQTDPRSDSAERSEVLSPLSIASTKMLRVTAQNTEGLYSPVKAIRLVMRPPVEKPVPGTAEGEVRQLRLVQMQADQEVQTSQEGSNVVLENCHRLITEGLQQQVITIEQVVEFLQQLIREVQGERDVLYQHSH
jgi:hypothetical protein